MMGVVVQLCSCPNLRVGLSLEDAQEAPPLCLPAT